MNPLSIITTADGSKTIFHSGTGEHYHSLNGAVQESRHVFLEAGLQYFLKQTGRSRVSVLEAGFGTGLNFLLSAQYCLDNRISLRYTGIEAFPLTQAMIVGCGYDQCVSRETWDQFIMNYDKALRQETFIFPSIQLEIINQPLFDFGSDKKSDVIFFDAFSAAAQPELWTGYALAHICQYLNEDGIFVTYAINGSLKRNMKMLGFSLEKLPGAAGKREMLRAVRPLFNRLL